MPDSFLRITFDLIAMFFIFFEVLEIPLLISFSEDIIIPPFFILLSQIIMIFFFIEIILNFNTAYYSKGIIELSRIKIAIHYLSDWFFIDFLSNFPLELLIEKVE